MSNLAPLTLIKNVSSGRPRRSIEREWSSRRMTVLFEKFRPSKANNFKERVSCIRGRSSFEEQVLGDQTILLGALDTFQHWKLTRLSWYCIIRSVLESNPVIFSELPDQLQPKVHQETIQCSSSAVPLAECTSKTRPIPVPFRLCCGSQSDFI